MFDLLSGLVHFILASRMLQGNGIKERERAAKRALKSYRSSSVIQTQAAGPLPAIGIRAFLMISDQN